MIRILKDKLNLRARVNFFYITNECEKAVVVSLNITRYHICRDSPDMALLLADSQAKLREFKSDNFTKAFYKMRARDGNVKMIKFFS